MACMRCCVLNACSIEGGACALSICCDAKVLAGPGKALCLCQCAPKNWALVLVEVVEVRRAKRGGECQCEPER